MGTMTASAPILQGKTLLLVEDDPTLMPFLEMLLADSGADLHSAMDPDQATAVLETLPGLDILVTDVVLPGRSGFQLAAEVIAKHPQVRVLFMSGFGDPEIGARGLQVKFDTLLKPFLPEDFTAKLLGLVRSVPI
jgi:DNA-binding response OmpR family regulator